MWYRMMLVLAACTLAFSFSAVAEETPGGRQMQGQGCEQFERAEDGRCVNGVRAERGESGRGDGMQGQGLRGRGRGQGNPEGAGEGRGGGGRQGGRR